MDSNSIFSTISKSDYKQYINIKENNPAYYRLLFIEDGSGIITHGKLYATCSYFIEVVNKAPDKQENDTIYLVKE